MCRFVGAIQAADADRGTSKTRVVARRMGAVPHALDGGTQHCQPPAQEQGKNTCYNTDMQGFLKPGQKQASAFGVSFEADRGTGEQVAVYVDPSLNLQEQRRRLPISKLRQAAKLV